MGPRLEQGGVEAKRWGGALNRISASRSTGSVAPGPGPGSLVLATTRNSSRLAGGSFVSTEGNQVPLLLWGLARMDRITRPMFPRPEHGRGMGTEYGVTLVKRAWHGAAWWLVSRFRSSLSCPWDVDLSSNQYSPRRQSAVGLRWPMGGVRVSRHHGGRKRDGACSRGA
ncbi:hypothetical protein HDV57DRAFT_1620 [Trichoderma longibrachiatum]|uniref:Uncharacterized protein n=1 Tax=Trichoderma longibrachiatum ATCC 18648 TaxID=983965 RepID=A0A2T4CK57_TRILO|nr:hypothetical protein M440DRAFT_1026548 [Trichoderma longibrachiatum ATCC 18648]